MLKQNKTTKRFTDVVVSSACEPLSQKTETSTGCTEFGNQN